MHPVHANQRYASSCDVGELAYPDRERMEVGVDTFSVFGGRLGHFITPSVKTQTARDLVIFNFFNLCYKPI